MEAVDDPEEARRQTAAVTSDRIRSALQAGGPIESWLDELTTEATPRSTGVSFVASDDPAIDGVDYAVLADDYEALLIDGAVALIDGQAPYGDGAVMSVVGAASGSDPDMIPAAVVDPNHTGHLSADDRQAVRFADILPGIDVVYSDDGRHLEYSFVVDPGADPGEITLDLDTATAPTIEPDGDLLIRTEVGSDYLSTAPITFQDTGDERVIVESSYVVHEDGTVGFIVGAYDPTLPLVIDPTFVAVDTAGGAYSSGSTIDLPVPSTVATDDLMIAQIAYSADGGGIVTPPAGWNTIGEAGANGVTQALFWRVATSSEPSQYSFTLSSGATNTAAGAITLYDGVDTVNPIDVVASQTNSGATVTAPSVTTTVGNATLIAFFAVRDDGSATPPAGMTERTDVASGNGGAAANEIIATSADEQLGAAGATGSRTATVDASAGSVGHTLALTPASGGGNATNLLMITTDGGFTNGNDSAKKALFESWGWTVSGLNGSSSSGAFAAAAAVNDVLFFSDTASGTASIVRTLDIGVVTEIFAGWDTMLYSGTNATNWVSGTTIDIVDNSHYITSPFATGSLTIHSSFDDVNYWNSGATALPSGVTALADGPWSSQHDAILVAETGAALYSANTAVNRRVWFPSDAANPSVFTSDYETLLERSLDWAAGNDVAGVSASPAVSVNSTGDSADNNIGDDLCDTGGTNADGDPECTLRAAIAEANASSLVDTIRFLIPTADGGHSAGVWTITPSSGTLPDLTATAAVDATTQAGWAGVPVVVIDGSSFFGGEDGLGASANGISITGLSVVNWPDDGIHTGQNGVTFSNLWLGALPNGAPAPNGSSDMVIWGSATGTTVDSVVFGAGGSEGAIVDSTTSGTVIRDSWFGTTPTFVNLSPSSEGLILDGTAEVTVTGTVFGNHPNAAIVPNAGTLTITGSAFGTDLTATQNMPVQQAVWSNGSANVTFGGTGPGDGNVVRNVGSDAIELWSGFSGEVAVLGNSIAGSVGLAIDLNGDGVSTNDATDGDGGANGRLNFPVITAASETAGTVTIDFDLDVPAGNYRIEGFTNPSGADPTGHGEGETFQSSTGIAHTGSGAESFQLAYSGVAGGVITLTATEDLGGGSFGATSEFSAAFVAACSDSDADGLLDCEEDANTDADDNPTTNPGPDTDGDTLPNYLDADDDGDGVPTVSENADPNADGDPRDAADADRDQQPDFLDVPTSAAGATVVSEEKVSDTEGGLSAALVDSDAFGSGAAPIGDLDRDGVVDIIVGALDDNDGASTAGAVYVLFLNADGTVKAEQKISNTSGGLGVTLLSGDSFGSAVTGLGDIDGDGIGDVMVAADQDDTGGGSNGAVYTLLLNADGTVKAEQKIAEGVGGLVANLNDNSRFGSSVSSLGDLDDDGINDVAVGALGDTTNGSFTGAVYVLFLNADGTVKAEQKITHGVGGLTTTIEADDTFGTVAGIGDLDGDGVEDLVAGAYADDDGGSNRGAVYVLFLNTDGTVKAEQKISSTDGGLSAALDDSDFFGVSLGPLGDFDADGAPDIVVGATWDDDGGSNAGAVYVLGLNTDGTVNSEQKITEGVGGMTGVLDSWDLFGGTVSGIGDLDGDGAINLVVGATGDDDGGSGRGAIHILDLAGCGSTDSDSDGLLDCFETVHGDTDGDTTPNHLDPDDDGDGTPTSAENADPNGDGDPRDAIDADRDGQPDYLDPPTAGSLGLVDREVKIASGTSGFSVTLGDSDYFGSAVTSIGDLNGDGTPELAASATGDDDTSGGSGAVYILFMNADGTVASNQKLSNLEGGVVQPWGVGDGYGDSVAGIGDIDGDGIPDLAIGAYDGDDGGSNRGEVLIAFLNADGTIKAEQRISELEGGGPALDNSDAFGAVTGLGDLDGDGINDIAVGAYGDDDVAGAGAIYVLTLNADGTVKTTQKISPTVGGFSGTLNSGDGLGRDIAGLGDVDGDGVPDLAAGVRYDDDGGSNRGAVWVLFLNTDGTVKGHQKISSLGGGLAGDIDNSDYFGESVAGVGDLDQDGTPDLVVGATGDDDGGTGRGALWVLFLEPDGTVGRNGKISDLAGNLTTALVNSDSFGSSVTGLGDLDGDGAIDLAVGAMYDDSGGSNRGSVYVLLTAQDLPTTTAIVNSTADGGDAIPGDGSCATATPGQCTLRAAIEEANASSAVDVIHFAIPQSDPGYSSGPDTFTFTPGTVYPNITERITIDGSTQTEFVDLPVIVIDGSLTGTSNVAGLYLDDDSDGSTVKALTIHSYDDYAIRLQDAGHTTITGMVLGLGRDGVTATGSRYGIYASWSPYLVLGGTTAAERNVLSGNNYGVALYDSIRATVTGNYFGTDHTGLLDRGNSVTGVYMVNSSSYGQVGGKSAAEANVIAGNDGRGVYIGTGSMADPVVEGNLIGLGADGTTQLPNGTHGIELTYGTGGRVIDNVIGPQGGSGVLLNSHDNAVVQGNVVGTDATQTEVWPIAANGITIQASTSDALIGGTGAGEPNLIANTTGGGIVIETGDSGNAFVGNVIRDVGGQPIDLGDDGPTANDSLDADAGPNDLLNTPEITAVTPTSVSTADIGYQLDLPAGNYRIEFYSNTIGTDTYGEAQTFEAAASVSHAGAGPESRSITLSVTVDERISAIAIEDLGGGSYGSTSEMAASFEVSYAATVNSTGDGSDATPGDNICDTGGTNALGASECTFRAAIEETNASTLLDTVAFNLPTADSGHLGGVWTFSPGTAYPAVTRTVTIDGSTQPGFVANTNASPLGLNGTHTLVLDGSSVPTGGDGLWLQATDVEVRGLVIGGFNTLGGYGIQVDGARAIIAGNYIGTDVAGSAAAPSAYGISIDANDGMIGGVTVADRNLISGNGNAGIKFDSGDNTQILGNLIGTTAAGNSPLVVAGDVGVNAWNGNNTRIGSAAAGNVIGGAAYGIEVVSDDIIIENNLIGTDASYTADLSTWGGAILVGGERATIVDNVIGNFYQGIDIDDVDAIVTGNSIGTDPTGTIDLGHVTFGIELQSTGARVGGTTTDESNIVAFNGEAGIRSDPSVDSTILGNRIFANGGLGIDLLDDGVTVNSGADTVLNHPVLTNSPESGGTVTVDFDLEVPAGDYRIELFTNAGGRDPSGYGEGQTFEHAVTVTHTGSGVETFSTSFSGVGGLPLAATATRDLGGGSYGATSEFSPTIDTCTDPDGDGLCSHHEALFGDTDSDTVNNQNDSDDDGDGTPTASENADLDGDGNPRDALDSDFDGQPDYLDVEAGVSALPVAAEQKLSDTAGGLSAVLADIDSFGSSATSLGDLDGDGVVDVVVGAPFDDDGGPDRGAVHVLFLNADGTVKAEQKISSTAGGLTGPLDDQDIFGSSVDGLGDLDGDGIADLVVGAAQDDDGGGDHGAAYVLLLNADGTVRAEQKLSDTAGGLAANLDPSDHFGRSVTGLGDVDGDGIVDLAIGASQDDDGGSDRGAAYVLFLNPDGTVKAEQKISDTSGGLTASPANADLFGYSMSGVGDLDADGVRDLIVGARSDDGGGADRGAVYVLLLNPGGTVKAEQKIGDALGGFGGALDDSDHFGHSIAGLGDLDGDGVGDVAVGVPGDDDGGTDHGAVFLVHLNSDGTVKFEQKVSDTTGGFTATLGDDGFGSSVSGLGDLDNDGLADLIVGAAADDDGGTDRGSVYVLGLGASTRFVDTSVRQGDLLSAGGMDPAATVGVVGEAASFDGSGARLVGPATDVTSGAWSLSGWVNASSFGTDPRIVAKTASDGDTQYELLIDDASASSGQAMARLKLGASTHVVSGGSVTTGGWHHLAASWDGTTLSLYVDGQLVDSAAAAGTIATDLTVPLTVGNLAAADRGVSGQIDEVRLTHSAIGPGRAAFDYANVNTPAAVISVGAEQSSAVNPWTIDGTQTRSGIGAASAPQLATSGADAWLTATGIDEPGIEFTSWWWMTTNAGIDLAAGTRTGDAPTDQYETALTSPGGWDLATDLGGARTQQAAPAGVPATGQWMAVTMRTDETGTSSVSVDGTLVIGPAPQGSGLISGSVGLRAGLLPVGQAWYVDDARARKFLSAEPTVSLGPLERE